MNTFKPILFLVALLLLKPVAASTYVDTIITGNNNMVVGEIKVMEKGILTIKTAYSNSDFKIKWKEVKSVSSSRTFLITLTNGLRINGRMNLVEPFIANIYTTDSSIIRCHLNAIIYLKATNDRIWDKFYATVDFGFSLTKSNNLKQLTARSTVGFISQAWAWDANFNTLNSAQDNTPDIHRTDASLNFNYFLPNDWYLPVSLNFLSNTEQQIELRSLAKIGIGNFVLRSNNGYLGFGGGGNYNAEKFSGESPDKQSWEAFASGELNLYDIGDLSLLSKIFIYNGITEKGRWRSDFNFDVKYKLPLDFYVRLGITMNYDNKPASNATTLDYVSQLTFGWSWKK